MYIYKDLACTHMYVYTYLYIHISVYVYMYLYAACLLSCFSYVRLFVTLWTVVHQAPLSMGFSRQEHWNGLPFPPPGDLPDPRIEPGSPMVQADCLPSEPPGKPQLHAYFLLLSQQETHLSPPPRGAQISVGLFTTALNVKNCKGYK